MAWNLLIAAVLSLNPVFANPLDCELIVKNQAPPLKNILVLVAMESEERAILANQEFTEVTISERMKIQAKVVKKGDQTIYVVKSGIGPVLAGVALTAVVEHFPIDSIFLLGVGGALTSELDIGDVVISSAVVQHDAVYTGDTGPSFMAPGEPYVSVAPDQRMTPVIPSNPSLRKRMTDLFRKNERTNRFFEGVILSGNEFVGSSARKQSLATSHEGALLVDMEAAAVAQLARRLGIPYVTIKTVADRLNPDGTVAQDYNRFLSAAATHAAEAFQFLIAGEE